MLSIWLGVLLIIGGLVYMAGQAIWRGPMSGDSRRSPAAPTLEPPQRGLRIFGLSRNWPGLALIAVGVVALFAGAASVPV